MNILALRKHKKLKALFEFISFFIGVIIFSAEVGLFITPVKSQSADLPEYLLF
jgi:hypothetical protein